MKIKLKSIEEWERERAKLSHDLLKNEIMPAVSKVLNVLAGKVADAEFADNFFELLAPRAARLCGDIEELAQCADSCLSPRHYFMMPPLSNLDSATLKWLPNVVHQNWGKESLLKERTQRAMEASAKVKKSLMLLRASWECVISERQKAVTDLSTCLHAFARAISDLGRLPPYQI